MRMKNDGRKKQKGKGILMKFALLFIAFAVMMLVWILFSVHSQQTVFFEDRLELQARSLSAFLREEIEENSGNFLDYTKYMSAHRDELAIPLDCSEYESAKNSFETAFAEAWPGKVYGEDVGFDQLSEELKERFTVWMHEYWLLHFETAKDTFHLSYVCYIIPGDEAVEYVIPPFRTAAESGDHTRILLLCESGEKMAEERPVLWKTWETGEPQKGHDTYIKDNEEYHAYYLPVILDGRVRGLICVDAVLTDVHGSVMQNTIRLGGMIAAGLFAALLLMLWVVNHQYIARIVGLKDKLRVYSETKDAAMAGQMRKQNRGSDEVSALTEQAADMIDDLDGYMHSLVSTTNELSTAQKRADEMNALAMNDSLTGIRNRRAYEKTEERLNQDIQDGIASFAIVMIDMNDLKKINDFYGHEEGNVALMRLSGVISRCFGRSPVYRIGGDEFVVVAENRDLKDLDALVERFNRSLREMEEDMSLKDWEQVHAAIGAARYEKGRDESVEQVFRRADERMYQDKQRKKAGNVRR